MEYTIRKATHRDLPDIAEVYKAARAFMAASGNPDQWGKTNPPLLQLLEDIDNGHLHLICAGEEICGSFALIPGEDPTYRRIDEGAWSRCLPYHTIHRLAGKVRGGIFRACMDYCRENCGYIRIDTHRDNRVMLHLLEQYGFTRCGIIYLASGDPRIAFDLKF